MKYKDRCEFLQTIFDVVVIENRKRRAVLFGNIYNDHLREVPTGNQGMTYRQSTWILSEIALNTCRRMRVQLNSVILYWQYADIVGMKNILAWYHQGDDTQQNKYNIEQTKIFRTY
jgi:hypothetical protein